MSPIVAVVKASVVVVAMQKRTAAAAVLLKSRTATGTAGDTSSHQTQADHKDGADDKGGKYDANDDQFVFLQSKERHQMINRCRIVDWRINSGGFSVFVVVEIRCQRR